MLQGKKKEFPGIKKRELEERSPAFILSVHLLSGHLFFLAQAHHPPAA
jgi:hypothetical protein